MGFIAKTDEEGVNQSDHSAIRFNQNRVAENELVKYRDARGSLKKHMDEVKVMSSELL